MAARQHPVFAAVYGLMGRLEQVAGLAERREHLLARASGRVVEIGAGTGMNFRHYPEAVREVIATEPEPNMLRRSRKAVREARVPIRLFRAPAERLPLEDGSVDTAVSTLVLCTVPDQAAALAEVRRVLKPGGLLLFFEHVRAPRETALARWQDRLERPWGFFAGGCHPNRDTERAIRDAGLEIEEVERFPFGIPLVRTHVAGVARAAS